VLVTQGTLGRYGLRGDRFNRRGNVFVAALTTDEEVSIDDWRVEHDVVHYRRIKDE